MLQKGQVFAGRYRIEAPVAQGGMGVIYAAEHLATEERVALKVLGPHVLGSKAVVENFQLEARVAARLGSEHIVRILDAGLDEQLGVPFLVMELLSGMTLQALVEETGPLPPAEALAALGQASRALDKAHGYVDRAGRPAPIVHRDLKPDNLFVSVRESGAACVKVLDFGIAKVLSASQLPSFEIKGTPLFMAPEQFGGGTVAPQLDVWAFGLIAFYLLAGRHYWLASQRSGGGIGPLLDEIIVQPLAPPTERARALGLRPGWPSGFDAWLLRCLEREPRARFASAGAAAGALLELFESGAGLLPPALEAAPVALARRVALGLSAKPKLTTATTRRVDLSVAIDSQPAVSTASDKATALGEASTINATSTPAGGRVRPGSLQARAASAVVALGVAAGVGAILIKGSMPGGRVGVTSASMAPAQAQTEAASTQGQADVAPANAPPPEVFALEAPTGGPATPAEVSTAARPLPSARVRPPRFKPSPGAEAVGRKNASSADDVGPRVEAPAPAAKPAPARDVEAPTPAAKPAPTRNVYNEL